MTTTALRDSTRAQEILDGVRELAPTISARAREIETARRLPRDLLDQLTAVGCFRIFLPSSHGGVGADLPSGMRVLEALSRADASVGWTVMLGSGVWIDLTRLPRPTFDALYANGPDAKIAGVFNPTGTAVAVAGGYRVSGRWAFASGCEHADWIYGTCMEEVDGEPHLRTVLFSPGEVTIEDTWHVSGLSGTGSHHFRADDVFVAAERTSRPFVDEPTVDTPFGRVSPPVPLIALIVSSVALGTAQGALDEILDIAAGKVPLLSQSPLAGNPLFQYQLATADTELRAARALVYDTAGSAWATATAGTKMPPEQRARIRAAVAWATGRAVAVVDTAYHAGGASAIYADSPLQRRLRDIHAITQHFLVKRDVLTTAGAVLADQDVDLTIF